MDIAKAAKRRDVQLSGLQATSNAMCIALSLGLLACGHQTDKTAQDKQSSQAQPSPAASTHGAGTAERKQEAQLSVASFRGDVLTHCLHIAVRTIATEAIDDKAINGVTLEASALMLFDNAVQAFMGSEDSELLSSGAAGVANTTAVLLNGLGANGDPETVAGIQSLNKNSWPTPFVAEVVKAGDMTRVPSCSFPNKVPLATCRIPIRANVGTEPGKAGEIPWHFNKLELDIDRQLYNRAAAAASDGEMKACLRLGGSWDLASPDSAAMSAAAQRQEPNSANDVRSLQLRAAQTQAAHMRAVAAHRSDPDCESYRECTEAIPSVRDLPAGEYARKMRSCSAAKTDRCSASEKALEQARAENIATQAELQAARAQARANP